MAEFIDLVEDVRKKSNGVEFVTRMKVPNDQNKFLRYIFPIVGCIF
jgi:hypothetical protein